MHKYYIPLRYNHVFLIVNIPDGKWINGHVSSEHLGALYSQSVHIPLLIIQCKYVQDTFIRLNLSFFLF